MPRSTIVSAGHRDLWCPLCGGGPYVSLAMHGGHMHGGIAAFRRALGVPWGVSLESEHYRRTRTELAEDQRFGPFPRSEWCQRGHLMRGRNLVQPPGRAPQCRTCMVDRARELRAARRGGRPPHPGGARGRPATRRARA